MSRYLIDSNIIIDYARKSEKAGQFLESLDELIVSVITVGEVYQGSKNRRELSKARRFFQTTNVLPITSAISQLSIRLIETYSLAFGLLIFDALIAATALEHHLTLVAGNAKHFRMIKGLRLKTW